MLFGFLESNIFAKSVSEHSIGSKPCLLKFLFLFYSLYKPSAVPLVATAMGAILVNISASTVLLILV